MLHAARRGVLLSQALIVPLAVSMLVLGRAAPQHYRLLLQEDQWAEWASFLAFGGAFVLYAIAAKREEHRVARALCLALAAFSLFVAGEEISWGHRLFAFKPPKLFLEHNFQQEPNFHNLLKSVLDTRWMVLAVALGMMALRPILKRTAWSSLAPSGALFPGLLLVAVLEITYPFKFTGELAELILGLVFVLDAMLRLRTSEKTALLFQGLVMIGGGLLSIGFNRVLYGPSEAAVAQTKAQLEQIRHDLGQPEARSPKLKKKRSVHKRLFTATRKGYLRFGKESLFLEGQFSPAEREVGAREDARGYMLDGWNQPYWLLYKRIAGRRYLGVYSFGANRRRDSNFNRLKDQVFEGDDLGFWMELTEASKRE